MKYIFIITLILTGYTSSLFAQSTIKVGAKHFNEGYILGEMIALLLEDGGFTVERKFGLGGTAVSFEALKSKDIDVYPEYSGTISAEILKMPKASLDSINRVLTEKYRLNISKPYGFNNTYVILTTAELAKQLSLRTIQDLAAQPQIKGGVSYEFLKREDGWKNLAKTYSLKQNPIGMEHGLAYQALFNKDINFSDAASTDGELAKYDCVILTDNLNFFPKYEALSFYQENIPQKAKEILAKLDNILTDKEMQKLNALALYDKKTHQEIAYNFLIEKQLIQNKALEKTTPLQDILAHALVHLKLTLISLLVAMLFAIPLGIVLYRFPAISKPILYIAGILQTVPSIALLALMIPFLGIGFVPAVFALFLYALLPILRNTLIGLIGVEPQLKKVATAIGLSYAQKLRLIELPLAMPMILAGIRTAAVINVGTATIAAFIGAGGLGEFIVTGLALNDTSLILMGAIPSALLAILMELFFELLERTLIAKHLR